MSRQKVRMSRISMFPDSVLHSICSCRTTRSAQFNINFFLTSRLRSWDTERTITDGERQSMKRKLLQSVCCEEAETTSTDLNKFFITLFGELARFLETFLYWRLFQFVDLSFKTKDNMFLTDTKSLKDLEVLLSKF